MKKTYMQPSMEMVKVQQEEMLIMSYGLGGESVDGSKALANDRYDFDDDDEDLGSIIPW